MDVPARLRARSAPPPTIAALVATLAIVVLALALHALGDASDPRTTRVILGLFTALLAVRVAGQVLVLLVRPSWLPPMANWNLLPYPILLPIQLALLALMIGISTTPRLVGAGVGDSLVEFACLYWAAIAVRYAVRMSRRPGERWFGGAIPIVFHCVIAAWVFVLGRFYAVG